MSREMKESSVSWIGKIPTSWEIHRMKSCIEDRTSGAWGNEQTGGDGDIICLRIADFDYSKFRFKDCSKEEFTIRNYDKTTIERLKLRKGDILIEKSGGGEKTPVGRTVIFDKDYPALYANFMDRLRCSDFVTSQWMQYLLVVFYKNDYSRNYIKQTTGIQNIDLASMLANEKVPIPSLIEQNRITSFLHTQCAHIDSVIEKTRAAIEEYKKLKQAVITQAVTKGIHPNREMKDSGIEWIGEIPSTFVCRKLKSFSTLISKGSTPKDISTEIDDKYVIRFLKSENIVENHLAEKPEFRITSDVHEGELKRSVLYENDILFVIAGASIGKTAIMDKRLLPANTNQAVSFIRIVPKYCFAKKYIWYFLQSEAVKRFIFLFAVQSAQPNLSMENLGAIRIPHPESNEEVSEIVAYLDEKTAAIDLLIQKKEQLITELEAYKKSLIYEYVTGKKEVV